MFGVDFFNGTSKCLIEKLKQRVLNKEKTFIITANPEIIMQGNKYPAYLNILKQSTFIVPDGVGIIMAGKILNQPFEERITGVDLMVKLLNLANKKRLSVYFLGATQKVNSLLIKEVKNEYPNIKISGYHHGFFENDEEIIREINDKEPDFVFVALGVPKQEEWIYKNLSCFKKGIFMGVGGSFDVLSKQTKRAPNYIRKIQLEWLYRILQKKSFKKLTQIFSFVCLTLKTIISEKREKFFKFS